MKIALTGATGIVGRFFAAAAHVAGHDVTTFGRRPLILNGSALPFQPWHLNAPIDLAGQEAVVHAGFQHSPGRYRGGEGDDPFGFRRANVDGTARLFDEAAEAGLQCGLFMSSRAVFDALPGGTVLAETTPVTPNSLYGEVKVAIEERLALMSTPHFRTVSLRATGVYGVPPGSLEHKWASLFRDFRAGRPIAPRCGTEVAGVDLAQAMLVLLTVLGGASTHAGGDGRDVLERGPRTRQGCTPLTRRADALSPRRDEPVSTSLRGLPESPSALAPHGGSSVLNLPPAVHVSDLLLDYRALLSHYAQLAGLGYDLKLPEPANADRVSVLDCATLESLGWQAGGWPLLSRTLAEIIESETSDRS